MRPNGKIFEDVSSLVTNAMGVAQGAKDEAQNLINARVERWLADRDLVTREEFEALRAMVDHLSQENRTLHSRLDALSPQNSDTEIF